MKHVLMTALVATMGYYDMVAMTLITAKAIPPLEPDVPQLTQLPKEQ